MAAPAVSSEDLVAIAQSYSIPPAILQGLMSRRLGVRVRAADGDARGLHLTAAQAAANPLLALETAARSLSQSFNEYGSWTRPSAPT